MVIGDRQRHRDLTVRLLAKLSAVLMVYPDRVPPLLGERRIVDDPCLDRPMPLDRRQHPLAHLAQHPLVRPLGVADKMQQGLMLCRHPARIRLRSHRLHALAFARQDQPGAVVVQRPDPIGVPNHARQRIHVLLKSRPALTLVPQLHLSLLRAKLEAQEVLDSQSGLLRPSDSVVLTLLRHSLFGLYLEPLAPQHGHRANFWTIVLIKRMRKVAIEFGTWRSGRKGGSSGSIIVG